MQVVIVLYTIVCNWLCRLKLSPSVSSLACWGGTCNKTCWFALKFARYINQLPWRDFRIDVFDL